MVTNQCGILLYRIPILRVVGHGPGIDLKCFWSGNASNLPGTLHKTASPHPALWLQGRGTTHTLEFDVDGSGFFPAVVNHSITGGRPAFYSAEYIKLNGWKDMSIESHLGGEIVFHTGTLENPNLMSRLRVSISDLNSSLLWDEFKYANLDELTGGTMIVVGPTICRRRGTSLTHGDCTPRIYQLRRDRNLLLPSHVTFLSPSFLFSFATLFTVTTTQSIITATLPTSMTRFPLCQRPLTTGLLFDITPR